VEEGAGEGTDRGVSWVGDGGDGSEGCGESEFGGEEDG